MTMRVWSWLAGPRHHDPRPDRRSPEPAPPASPAEAAPAAEPPSRRERVEVEIVERQRSIDGLNPWQQEQVRQMIHEEIAALRPLLEGAVRAAAEARRPELAPRPVAARPDIVPAARA